MKGKKSPVKGRDEEEDWEDGGKGTGEGMRMEEERGREGGDNTYKEGENGGRGKNMCDFVEGRR